MTSLDQTTLSTNNITDRVRRQTIAWVQTMQREYGQDMGMKCFDVIRETFGEDLCGAVLFGLMEGKSHDTLSIFTSINQSVNRKIEAIKIVRTLTGWGLKEAKDAVEACEYRSVDLDISWELRKVENQDKVERYVRELEMCGVSVR